MTINPQVPQHEPVKNFFKNFWQPWQAPKGERIAPTIGFIAATILFLPLFLPAVGIAALARWAIKHRKDSSPEVQSMAGKVESLVSKNVPREERNEYLNSVRAKLKDFQDFLGRLEVTEEYEREKYGCVAFTKRQCEGLEEILTELENNIDDSEKFNKLVKEAEGQIGALHHCKVIIEKDLNDPECKDLISIKNPSS